MTGLDAERAKLVAYLEFIERVQNGDEPDDLSVFLGRTMFGLADVAQAVLKLIDAQSQDRHVSASDGS